MSWRYARNTGNYACTAGHGNSISEKVHPNSNVTRHWQQCTKLCVKTKGTPSVLCLSRKDQNKLTSFTWMQILNELKDRAPDVLEILTTIAVPNLNDGRQVVPLCAANGVLTNQRCKELTLIQKVNTILLGTGSAEEVIWVVTNCFRKVVFMQIETLLSDAFFNSTIHASFIDENI